MGLPAFALISSRRALSWEISTSSYLMFFPSRILVTSLCWDLIWKSGGKGNVIGTRGGAPKGERTLSTSDYTWPGGPRGGEARSTELRAEQVGMGHREKRGGRAERERQNGAGRGGSSLHRKGHPPGEGVPAPPVPSPAVPRSPSPPGSRSPTCCTPSECSCCARGRSLRTARAGGGSEGGSAAAPPCM